MWHLNDKSPATKPKKKQSLFGNWQREREEERDKINFKFIEIILNTPNPLDRVLFVTPIWGCLTKLKEKGIRHGRQSDLRWFFLHVIMQNSFFTLPISIMCCHYRRRHWNGRTSNMNLSWETSSSSSNKRKKKMVSIFLFRFLKYTNLLNQIEWLMAWRWISRNQNVTSNSANGFSAAADFFFILLFFFSNILPSCRMKRINDHLNKIFISVSG